MALCVREVEANIKKLDVSHSAFKEQCVGQIAAVKERIKAGDETRQKLDRDYKKLLKEMETRHTEVPHCPLLRGGRQERGTAGGVRREAGGAGQAPRRSNRDQTKGSFF